MLSCFGPNHFRFRIKLARFRARLSRFPSGVLDLGKVLTQGVELGITVLVTPRVTLESSYTFFDFDVRSGVRSRRTHRGMPAMSLATEAEGEKDRRIGDRLGRGQISGYQVADVFGKRHPICAARLRARRCVSLSRVIVLVTS
jgi:hypothetical protein